jgi:hypothetical protein
LETFSSNGGPVNVLTGILLRWRSIKRTQKDEIRRRIIDAAYESFWRSGFGIEVDDALAIAEQVDV